MVTGILSKKLGMTRIFTEDGRWIEVTLLEAGPCTVVQRKTAAVDGYDAVQLGFGEKPERVCTKPALGHFKKAGQKPSRTVREFRIASDDSLNVGDTVKVDLFQVGDRVDVVGTSKGRGTAGLHKRHHFGGGPGTHGSNFHRRAGSIGSSADPSRTFRGMRMAGHMGDARVTTQNLEVVRVDAEKNLIAVRGSVPGANGGVVVVRKAVKGPK
jgi:large subunit ribosomal protein L3